MGRNHRTGKNLVALIVTESSDPAPHSVTMVYLHVLDKDNRTLSFQRSFAFTHPGGFERLVDAHALAWMASIQAMWKQKDDRGARYVLELRNGLSPSQMGLSGRWAKTAEA
jgi:hypothetical protein